MSTTASAFSGSFFASRLVPNPLLREDSAPEARAPQSPTSSAASQQGVQPDVISQWMSAWNTRGYQGPLVVSRFREPIYFLYQPIKWKPATTSKNKLMATFTVPKGFVTDLTSIPQVFWSLLRPDGNYAYSAVLHDYLYWFQSRPREVADEIFRQSMKDFRVPSSTVEAIHAAVRLGGGSSWDDNARRKARGERRVLAKFPDDPTISWSDWQKDKGNFASS
ncbi:MAG: DUF1353 domain-containing protein [Gemmatimonadetes bacterium]|nr:DUF1353 domain-containing protein [Gemmatimonadota bacterium]